MNIWQKLSSIDVSKHIEKKMNLSYLSWAWAWGTLMEHYPTASYHFDDPVFFENGTCEVWVTIKIEDQERKMWLPVMNHKNMAIPNPSSRDISDTRMRCLVKCLAMFGLGHYIYAGEDLPSGEIKGLTTGEPVDLTKIKRAYDFFKAELNKEGEPDYAKLQGAFNRLKNDEQIAVMDMLGDEKLPLEEGQKGRARQYKNVLNDCLKVVLDEDGNIVREVA